MGLTYNLLGRIYSIREKDEESFSSAKQHYKKAIESFTRADHYRGIYMSLKDLHDLQQWYVEETNISDERKAKKLVESCVAYQETCNQFKRKF